MSESPLCWSVCPSLVCSASNLCCPLLKLCGFHAEIPTLLQDGGNEGNVTLGCGTLGQDCRARCGTLGVSPHGNSTVNAIWGPGKPPQCGVLKCFTVETVLFGRDTGMGVGARVNTRG